MKILIAGGSGFVGSRLAALLAAEKYDIDLIIRPTVIYVRPEGSKIEIIIGDPGEPLNLDKRDYDAIINTVGIIREFPSRNITFKRAHYDVNKNLVDYARANGIKKFLLMSALGVKSAGKTGYQKSKWDAEQYLINSRLDWTIFRPSMIFGTEDKSVNFFAGLVKKLPLVPVIGDGKYRLQPVFIDDVCYAFRLALGENSYTNRILEFGGPEILAYNQLLDVIGGILGRNRVAKIHLPVAFMRAGASLLGWVRQFPLTNEQITMLLEENFTDPDSYEMLFRRKPLRLADGLKRYLK